MQAIFENPRVESFSLKSSPGAFSMGQHHRPIMRRRSLKDLPGGIRVPVLKKSDRLKTRLEASLAGLQELQALREKHQLLVTQAKTSLQKSQESWSSAHTDYQESQQENGDIGRHDGGSSHLSNPSVPDQKSNIKRSHQEITLPEKAAMDTREVKSLVPSSQSMEGQTNEMPVAANRENLCPVEAETSSRAKDGNTSTKACKQIDMSYKECNVNIQNVPEENEVSDRSNLLRRKSFSVCQLTREQKGTESVVDLNSTSSLDSHQNALLKRKDSILAGVDITSQGPNPVHAILMAYTNSYRTQSMSSLSGSLSRTQDANSPTNSSPTLTRSGSDKSNSLGSVFSFRTMEYEDSGTDTWEPSDRSTRTVLKNLDSISKGVNQSTQTADANLPKNSKVSTKVYIKQSSARKSCEQKATVQTPPVNNHNSIRSDTTSVAKIYQDNMGSLSTKSYSSYLSSPASCKLTQPGSFNVKCNKELTSRPHDTTLHGGKSIMNNRQLSRKNKEDGIRNKRTAHLDSESSPLPPNEPRNKAGRESFSKDNSRLSPRNVHRPNEDARAVTTSSSSLIGRSDRSESVNHMSGTHLSPNHGHDGKQNDNLNTTAETSEYFPHRLSRSSQSVLALTSMNETIAEPGSTGDRKDTDRTNSHRVLSVSAAKRTVNCDIPGTTKVRRFGMPLDSKSMQNMLKRQEKYQPLPGKLSTKTLVRSSSTLDYENVNVSPYRQTSPPRVDTQATIENNSSPLSSSVRYQRTPDSDDGQMSLLGSSRLATSTPVISKKWVNSLTKLSFASDEGYCPSSTSSPKSKRQSKHKLSLRSNVTWISTDLDDSNLSPRCENSNVSHILPSPGRWKDSPDSHRIISPSRITRDWDTCSYRSSVSMLSIPTDVQESAI